jgi:hypothetical protein
MKPRARNSQLQGEGAMSSSSAKENRRIDVALRAVARAMRRVRLRRRTRVIWCPWFRATLLMDVVGVFRGVSIVTLFCATGIAALIALGALGIRWLEHRLQGP